MHEAHRRAAFDAVYEDQGEVMDLRFSHVGETMNGHHGVNKLNSSAWRYGLEATSSMKRRPEYKRLGSRRPRRSRMSCTSTCASRTSGTLVACPAPSSFPAGSSRRTSRSRFLATRPS